MNEYSKTTWQLSDTLAKHYHRHRYADPRPGLMRWVFAFALMLALVVLEFISRM